jgi:PST family polysaccharide transporter
VARFYGEGELAPITAVLSVTFLVGGVTIQHDALLRRHLRFRALVAVQLLSQVANLAVAVAMAANGAGYWALVGGALAATLSASLLTLLFCPFVPRRPRRGVGIRSMLVFGGHVTGFSVINYFGRNTDNILVGRFLGPTQLGLYSRAYSLFMVPITQIRAPISQVALPVLSSLVAEPERYRRYYLRLLEAVTLLAAPATVYCVLEAEFLVRLLLGPDWAGVVPVFRILAVAGMVQPMASTVGLVFVSLGHADRQLKNGAVNSAVAVVAFCLGLPFGIEGVAAFYAVSSYLVLVPMLRYAFRGSPVRTADFAFTVWFPLAAALGAGLAVLVIQRLVGNAGSPWHVVVAVLFFGAYAALVLSRRSARESLKALVLEARTRQ